MESWTPEGDFGLPDEPGEDRPSKPVAFVSTHQTVSLHVDEVEDDRTPEGLICMGTYFNQRLIARSIVPPETLAEVEAHGLLSSPVRLGLAAFEDAPGLQCRLFALLPASQLKETDEPEEPWAASVPRFEDGIDGTEQEEDVVVPLLLGHVVRFARDRRHPDDLAAEAADILRAILSNERPLSEIVDKILEDL